MANENPAASADSTVKKAAPAKKAAAKKSAPKKKRVPKPKPAAAAPVPPAASAAGEQVTQVAAAKAAEPTPLEVGQKVRWYPNGSEQLPGESYEAHIVELPNANGIASLVVSIEGEVKHRASGRKYQNKTYEEGTSFFIPVFTT